MTEKNFHSVDFDDMMGFLDHLFEKDEKAKSILKEAGFSRSQIQIINTLIITALKDYDRQKQQ